jgi:peptide/nickel transport system ATP-binding protein/oligopeptide transport system ATP-binding protein
VSTSPNPLLQIRDLRTYFHTEAGTAKAVDGVNLDIYPGEVVGLVGESGSGKSVTALSILRLIPDPPGKVQGSILFKGRDLMKLSWDEIHAVRGKEISMIFQEPMTSLNPVFTIGMQLTEAVLAHEHVSKQEAFRRCVEMLELVEIPSPASRMNDYPQQFSGGMRQRVMIAMALACDPALLIADEPTTALDVTIQAQILELIRDLRERLGTAVILITHDLGVVAENADRVVVMYAGRKVEEAAVDELFDHPGHPYTKGLLGSIPQLDAAAWATSERPRLIEIKGMVPSLAHLPTGCAFAPRCGFATEECRNEIPPLLMPRPEHWIACWHADRVLNA